jgi:hypothetical protein
MAELNLSILVLIAVALNVPFGAYRATTERLSVRWFLAIHLPIPFIILLRLGSGYTYRVIPLMIAASVAGQFLGSWAYARWRAVRAGETRAALPVAVAADEPPPKTCL